MTDKDKVAQMEDLNWKPAAQYWKDKAEKAEAELERVKKMRDQIVGDKINLRAELDTKQKELTSTALDYLAASGQAAENLERALEAEKRLEVYQKVIRSLYPDMSGYYFICGSGGAEDANGLPERLLVCPAMGVGWSVTYVKTDQVSSVEGL